MNNAKLWLQRLVPFGIAAALWLDGWVYPLIVLPLVYVWFVKKDFGWIGFRRTRLLFSVLLGIASAFITILVWYPLFLHYLPYTERSLITPYVLFTDVIWYPFYEEIAYRGFIIAHLSEKGKFSSSRNTLANLVQTLLFLSVHHKYVTSATPFMLAPVFLLALLNGLIFLKTRNIFGCILCHSLTNGLAFVLSSFTG